MSATDPNKTYVIAKACGSGFLYLTISKGKRSKQYWGNYIGHTSKRYGAERFIGGENLDHLLALNRNLDLTAVEVKA